MPEILFIDQMSLWQNQQEAIEKMCEYIDAYHKKKTSKSALVHMPTGSGKTGVMAVLSRCVHDINSVLVVTNRIAIREQLTRHIKGEFFQMLERSPSIEKLPKEVIELTGPFVQEKYSDINNIVFVCTIQKLQRMKKNEEKKFKFLLDHITIVLFDEGHYEPSRKWSQTIRMFQTPRILFTATPYRNDLKLFDFDKDYIFSYRYHDGVENALLREVQIVDRDNITKPEDFIKDVLLFYTENLGKKLKKDARVIIRCENRSNIRLLTEIIRQEGYSVISLHDLFSDTDDKKYELRTVPNPKEIDALFWIHQYKLLEGIDDSRFQLLAIYDPFSSVRQLVQQIGRVIRNPDRGKNIKGYVLDHSANGLHQKLWDGFLAYDQSLLEPDKLKFAVGQEWLEKIIKAQPGLAYIKGSFRELFDIDDVNNEDILIPQRVNILEKLDSFDLNKLCDYLSNEFDMFDRIHRLKFLDLGENKKVALYAYIDLKPSPSLSNKIFFETKLEFTLIYETNKFVAYFDDHNSIPKNNEKLGTGKSLNPRLLKKLFHDDEETYLTQVSLKNSNLGIRTIRSRALRAAKLNETISALDDHAQICTTVVGYIPEYSKKGEKTSTRRYVGLSSGRVSQPNKGMNIKDYLEWIDGLIVTIKKSNNYKMTFNRYAPEYIEEIDDPTPVHILLDLLEIEKRFDLVNIHDIDDNSINISDVACEINQGSFELLANDIKCNVAINYDKVKRQYLLSSADLDRIYRSTYKLHKKGIVDYLNQAQSFRVIPKSEGLIYVYGEFYRPIYKLGEDFNINEFAVGQTLFDISKLANTKFEKFPTKEDKTGWDESCLFGFIDNFGEGTILGDYAGDPNIVICDDMSTEIADFIYADQKNNKIIFIHAKNSPKKRLYSASALHDVCSQATKNINYLGLFNSGFPPNLNLWDDDWKSKGNTVKKRIRRGSESGKELWVKIRKITNHPLAEKEVWLVLGQTLSKARFFHEISKPTPTPEAVQAAYLLHATMTSVASVGAKMRIFCSP